MIELLHAALLGILEGLTEFLPVSSTGHLILAIDLFGLHTPPGKVFEIVIQLGAILAICWLYRAKLLAVMSGAWKELSLPESERSEDSKATQKKESVALDCPRITEGGSGNDDNIHFFLTILIAFLPAAIVGALAHSFIKEVLFSTHVVGAMLIIGGLVILLIERIKPQPRVMAVEKVSFKQALGIGLCQMIAMIPGTSRSGATMMGALMFGLERKAAAEFSFFLAIPTMLGATVYDLYKNWSMLDGAAMEMIAAGFVAAFLSALLVVRWFIAFISKHGFVPFAYYRIVVGTLILSFLA